MLTVLIKHSSDSVWATASTTLEVLNALAELIQTRRGLLSLRTLTTGFRIVDDKPEKNARIVITPEHLLRPEKGGEVAVRFLGETEYYTFDQIANMFKGKQDVDTQD